jgi:hypothetical protein
MAGTMDPKRQWDPDPRVHFFLLGLAAFLWLLIRTGLKPSRIVYPCQQASAATASLWYATYLLPLVAMATPGRMSGRRQILIGTGIAILAAVTILMLLQGGIPAPGPGERTGITVEEHFSSLSNASAIYVVNGTNGQDGGVEALIHLMEEGGLPFFQTVEEDKGLIGSRDVILLKVNSQWDQRGGTNTDLVRSVIEAITRHPEGFQGEIIIADNGQGRGSLDWERNNAEASAQSMEDVATAFAGEYRVSTVLWDRITYTRVEEYDTGDLRDGYIVAATPDPETGIYVSYPKFTTPFGTRVSLKNGIWEEEIGSYDKERLRLLNLPVLKTHFTYGVTGAVKHYMGVVSNSLTSAAGRSSHDAVGTGGMGTEMVEARYPDLTILDAIWVNAHPRGGPWTAYDRATRLNVIAASTDPVALDAWGARSLLMPTAQSLGYTDLSSLDPDHREPGSFGYWLTLAEGEIRRGGYLVTMDEGSMTVSVMELGT